MDDSLCDNGRRISPYEPMDFALVPESQCVWGSSTEKSVSDSF